MKKNGVALADPVVSAMVDGVVPFVGRVSGTAMTVVGSPEGFLPTGHCVALVEKRLASGMAFHPREPDQVRSVPFHLKESGRNE